MGLCCHTLGHGFCFAGNHFDFSKIKYPYNVNQLTQKQAMEMLYRYYEIERWVKTLKEERENLGKRICETALYGENISFGCKPFFWSV